MKMNKKAFTLVEMLFVVVIALMALGFSAYKLTEMKTRGYDKGATGFLVDIAGAKAAMTADLAREGIDLDSCIRNPASGITENIEITVEGIQADPDEGKGKTLAEYLSENNSKDNIEIAYMEQEELIRIYKIIRSVWSFSFIYILIFYIIKFFDILLKKIELVHYIISILLIVFKELVVFLFFSGLTTIVYLLNKSYDKGQRVQTDEEENNFTNGEKIKFEGEDEENGKINKKGESHKLEIELEDINIERNTKKNEYKNIENSQNDDNIIEIDNLDISNGKENKNNEEEKLDEEDDTLKINNYSKETDKLK